ncbi:MAG: hypothetical protein MI748_14015 [Opitutales bacterium]|nr:hypothetical protein [Opitutales bacterium]
MDSSQPIASKTGKKFLGIHFLGCNTYGRLYPNKEKSHYVGRCPRCGLTLKVKIGAHGTDERFFRSTCLMNRIGSVSPKY